MHLNDFEPEELIQAANARMEFHAAAVARLAGAFAARSTMQDAVNLAKGVWISLMADPELAALSARPAFEQTAGRLASRLAEDSQS